MEEVKKVEELDGAVSRLSDTLGAAIERVERDAFEAWAIKKWGREAYRHVSGTCGEWDAWMARAAHQRQCRGVSHPGCNYLAPCGSVCDKCGQRT